MQRSNIFGMREIRIFLYIDVGGQKQRVRWPETNNMYFLA